MIRIGIDTCGAFDLNFAFTYLNTDKTGQECCGVITDCDECPSIINAHSGTCLGKCSDAVGLIAYHSYSGSVDINNIIEDVNIKKIYNKMSKDLKFEDIKE